MKNSHARLLLCLLLLAALCLLPACQQEMASQPSARPFEPSSFFADGRASRPLVEGTVARGHLRTDYHFFAGQSGPNDLDASAVAQVVGASATNPMHSVLMAPNLVSNVVDTFPFPITYEVLKHGKSRFMIYCVVCHDTLGTGQGMIVERGYTDPPSYHIERLRKAPVGHFFQVMTKGYGSMPSYRHQIPPRDRWAIAAYIRALQLSQHFPEKKLTDEMRGELAKQRKAEKGGGQKK